MGPLLHRRLECPSHPGSRRGRTKNIAEEPEDHALGLSRGGRGTKFHLVTDGAGTPLAVHVTAGQAHECTQVEPVLNAVKIGRRKRPRKLAGDKGYSYRTVRRWLHRYGIQAVIPLKDNQKGKPGRPVDFDRDSYRKRNVVERCVGWLKECRTICTRFDKLAVNFLATLKLAMIKKYLKMQSSDRA